MGLGPKTCRLFEQGHRRYPNAGGYMGYARSLLQLFNTIRSLPPDMISHFPGTDQGLVGQLYLTHHFPGVAVDTNSNMWATFCANGFRRVEDHKGVSWAAWVPATKNDDVLPAAALHFNGAGTRCFRSIEAAMWY